jgi:hypothetical protein
MEQVCLFEASTQESFVIYARTSRIFLASIAIMFAGCVSLSPRISGVIDGESLPETGYGRYLQAEQVVERAGFQRILIADATGRPTRLRLDTANQATSFFARSRGGAEQTSVNLLFDKKSFKVRLQAYDPSPQTWISDGARRDFDELTLALKAAIGEAIIVE